MEIGALDQNNVIKTANGIPYIPGSSLKGKLRNMLVKITGSPSVDDKKEKDLDVYKIFGVGAKDSQGNGEALLRVRDADLDLESVEKFEMDFEYSEVKYENDINRVTGKATPRPMERVPAGAIFNFEMIYDCFDENKEKDHLKTLAFAMKMLQYDSLGGSGTRGSGKIRFTEVKVLKATINTGEMVIDTAIDANYTQFEILKEKEDANSDH